MDGVEKDVAWLIVFVLEPLFAENRELLLRHPARRLERHQNMVVAIDNASFDVGEGLHRGEG